jgi:hypothetical protein
MTSNRGIGNREERGEVYLILQGSSVEIANRLAQQTRGGSRRDLDTRQLREEEIIPPSPSRGGSGGRFERHIVLSDYHIRNYKQKVWDEGREQYRYERKRAHDPRAMAVVEEFMKAWQPHGIWYNGDFIDFHGISRFCKTARDAEGMQADLDELLDLFERHQQMWPDAKRRFLLGNHDARFEPYIEQYAPALADLRCLSYHTLFQTKRLGLELHPYKERVSILPGVLEITHGDKVSKHSGQTAQKMLEMGVSGVSGHVHRLGLAFKTTRVGTTVWAEGGCLCSLEPDYMVDPNWQQGFTTILVDRENRRFHMDLVPIINGRIVYQGDVFEA